MALAPCLLGYGDVAKMLHGDARSKREDNRYWEWIENYVADDYTQAVKTGSGEIEQPCRPLPRPISALLTLIAIELLEKHAVLQSASRIEELVKIFIHATKVSGAERACHYARMMY